MKEENIVKELKEKMEIDDIDKNSPAPYLNLFEILHTLGYQIVSFKDKSDFDEKYTLTIFRPHS